MLFLFFEDTTKSPIPQSPIQLQNISNLTKIETWKYMIHMKEIG